MANLISPAAWTTGGPGAATAPAVAGGTLSLTGTGTGTTYARQPVPTVPGETYWFAFEVLTGTVLPGRLVGTTAGGGQVVASATAVPWSNRVAFTATGPQTWIQLQRQNPGEARVNAVSVERVSAANRPARRCNGVNQYLRLDAFSLGLRTANYNFFIGGRVRFEAPTAGAVYLADFGRADGDTAGGQSRVRLAAGTGADARVFCSSGAATGGAYRERATNTRVDVGRWYHAGVLAEPNGDVRLYWDGEPAGTATGTVPAMSPDAVCRVLMLAAKGVNPPSTHAPVSYSDWIWYSGMLPTGEQVRALAGGTLPGDLTGFRPAYHWPMSVDGGAEPSVAVAATLSSSGAPGLAPGPVFGAVPDPAATIPLDIVVV